MHFNQLTHAKAKLKQTYFSSANKDIIIRQMGFKIIPCFLCLLSTRKQARRDPEKGLYST